MSTQVRNLVSFVRKRDKRVQSYKKLLEDRAALNRQKQEQNRLEHLRKRKKELEELQKSVNSTVNDSYEEQLRQLEQEYGDSENEDYSDDEDYEDVVEGEEHEEIQSNGFDYLDSSYCVACNKAFTNENAFLNHQSSKKHKINVELLKDLFREEKETLQGEKCSDINEIDLDPNESDSEEIKVTKQKSRKNKKSKKSQQEINEEDTPEFPDLLEQVATEQNDWEDSTKSKKKQKSKKGVQKKNGASQSTPIAKDNNSDEPKSTEKVDKNESLQTDVNHTCVTCQASFESKNKLFTHLKKTNHGVYIPRNSTPVIGQNEKMKKGKRNK